MSEADAKSLMIAGCQIVYDGITYRRIQSVQLTYIRRDHKMVMLLVLEDMRANAVVVAPASKCVPVLLD